MTERFDTDVLERSRTVPVVVDFWAEWCAPCRMLGPVIEALAEEAAGRWELVKIDADKNRELMARYGVMGIPAVKMFHEGEVIAEFAGALPEDEIRRWIDAHLPDPRQGDFQALIDGWEGVDPKKLRRELESFVEVNPDFPAARLFLAHFVVFDEPSRAEDLVRDVREDADTQEKLTDLATMVDLMRCESFPAALETSMAAARQALGRRDWDGALENLVEAVRVDRSYGDDIARRSAVAIFHLLGARHELTDKHQRRLAMVLNP